MHHTTWPMHRMIIYFLAEMTKADHQLSESFYFIKICFRWVSYESFPILFGVFLTQKLSLGYSRINPNRKGWEQLDKLLKITYHRCSTYQYAKAQIKWVKNQKLIRCSNHCFQNWLFSWVSLYMYFLWLEVFDFFMLQYRKIICWDKNVIT